jgi:hypothetical protein
MDGDEVEIDVNHPLAGQVPSIPTPPPLTPPAPLALPPSLPCIDSNIRSVPSCSPRAAAHSAGRASSVAATAGGGTAGRGLLALILVKGGGVLV